MRIHVILRYVGLIILLNAVFLFIAALISFTDSGSDQFPLVYTAIIALLFGIFPLIFIPPSIDISNKEGLAIVVSSWLTSAVIGMLPYLLWGGEFSLTNAWFESVSGYTTTGSTILSDIEALPRGLLFWRATTHWIGGTGIIVFVLAILPFMGVAGMVLYRSEVSHHTMSQFRFRTRQAAQILLSVYIGLTVAEIVTLVLAGMGLFDAVTHSFATIATGGFSTRNLSIAYYDSIPIEVIIIIFMIISGIHFGLLYSVITKSVRKLMHSAILKYYLLALLAGTIIVALKLHFDQAIPWGTAFRWSAFNIVSVGTSTGFASTDTNLWPPLAKVLIIFFSLQCACAGSTSGGIKVDRIVLFVKAMQRKMLQFLHPSAIIPVTLDKSKIDVNALEMSVLYISVYMFVVFISTALLAAIGVDVITAFSGSVATMGNVGPGLVGSDRRSISVRSRIRANGYLQSICCLDVWKYSG
ncbi:MAG: potassium transporter TrkG [Candidatus Neomarinimicrobiota bacterium]